MLFLLFASPWFLIADLLFLAGLVTLVEFERGTVAGIVLAIAFAAFCFFAAINPLTWVLANPGTLILTILGYGAIGIVWSIIKWFFYTRNDTNQAIIKAAHNSWKDNESKKDTARTKEGNLDTRYKEIAPPQTFEEYMKTSASSSLFNPKQNKVRITRWMIWWPTSIIWTLLSDLIINIFNFIYDKLAFVFKSILDGQIKRAIQDD